MELIYFKATKHDHGDHSHDHDHNHESEGHGGHKHEFKPEIFCIIVGIFFFYMVDRLVGSHHHHHEEHDHEQKSPITQEDLPLKGSPNKSLDNSEEGIRKRGKSI